MKTPCDPERVGQRAHLFDPFRVGSHSRQVRWRCHRLCNSFAARTMSRLSQQRFHILNRPPQHCAIIPLDNWSLNQVGMLDHQRDDFVVAEIFLSNLQFAIDRFAAAQKLARVDTHLLDQIAQLLLVQRLNVVIDLSVIDAALTEQLVQLATFASSGFFVNCDHKNLSLVLRSLYLVPFRQWTTET